MSEVPYIRWRWSEFLSGRLSRRPAVEQATFHLLVGMICQKGEPIMLSSIDYLDLASRMHITKVDAQSAVNALVEWELVSVSNGVYMIDFLREEFGRISSVAKARKEAADKRWADANASRVDANAMHVHTSAMQTDASFSENEKDKEKEKDKENDNIDESTLPTNLRIDWAELVKRWNEEVAPATRAGKIRGITPKRKGEVITRMRLAIEHLGFADWREVMDAIVFESESVGDFLRSGTWFSFDWMFGAVGNLAKFLEGKYRHKKQQVML